jgi:hypothetical protein
MNAAVGPVAVPGATDAMPVFALVAVNVPPKPDSVTLNVPVCPTAVSDNDVAVAVNGAGVGVGDGVWPTGVAVAVGVCVGVGACVGVGVGVGVWPTGVAVGVGVAVPDGVGVGVTVSVAMPLLVVGKVFPPPLHPTAMNDADATITRAIAVRAKARSDRLGLRMSKTAFRYGPD